MARHRATSKAITCGSVAIPAESHKTRLLERKMEIELFLSGAKRYLVNACSVLSIFDDRLSEFSSLRFEKLPWVATITLRHVNDMSAALLARRVSARAKRVPVD